MYNRYIPQNDGSYSRKHMPESPRPAPSPPPPPQPCPQEYAQHSCPGPARQETGIGSFLRKILPKEFDTGDLMIILLLLLMAGDCQEDQNWAILTLVLYLFL
jgi:hypothetical protein